MIDKQLADLLLALGMFIGIAVKTDALLNKNTQWPRRSSGLNIIAYPITGLLPYYILELWTSFFTTFITMLIWIGIFVYRPEK